MNDEQTICNLVQTWLKASSTLGNYGFSTKFAWVLDRFGDSWQLNRK